MRNWGYKEALDAARFLNDEGWLPSYYALRLSEWLRTTGVPDKHKHVVARLAALEFSSNAGNQALYRWVLEESPLRRYVA